VRRTNVGARLFPSLISCKIKFIFFTTQVYAAGILFIPLLAPFALAFLCVFQGKGSSMFVGIKQWFEVQATA